MIRRQPSLIAPGFSEVRRAVVAALLAGDYLFEARGDIDVKNLLATGQVSAAQLVAILDQATSGQYTCSPHHRAPSVLVHVIVSGGWYVKFYVLDPDTWFIGVHPSFHQ